MSRDTKAENFYGHAIGCKDFAHIPEREIVVNEYVNCSEYAMNLEQNIQDALWLIAEEGCSCHCDDEEHTCFAGRMEVALRNRGVYPFA